jgi:hypothetical protein
MATCGRVALGHQSDIDMNVTVVKWQVFADVELSFIAGPRVTATQGRALMVVFLGRNCNLSTAWWRLVPRPIGPPRSRFGKVAVRNPSKGPVIHEPIPKVFRMIKCLPRPSEVVVAIFVKTTEPLDIVDQYADPFVTARQTPPGKRDVRGVYDRVEERHKPGAQLRVTS